MSTLHCNKCLMNFRTAKPTRGSHAEKHTCSEPSCKLQFSSAKDGKNPSVIRMYVDSQWPYPPHTVEIK